MENRLQPIRPQKSVKKDYSQINSEYDYFKKKIHTKTKHKAIRSFYLDKSLETNMKSSFTTFSKKKNTLEQSFPFNSRLQSAKSTPRPTKNLTKIPLNYLFALKTKLNKGEKLSKGEISELRYGKLLPVLPFNKGVRQEYKQTVMQILRNKPQIILNLCLQKPVSDKEIIEFFALDQVDFKWTNLLEKRYRKVCLSKMSSNLEFKNTFFLVNLGFHRLEKEVFNKRHLVSRESINDKEIERVYSVYEELRKTKTNTLKKALNKVDYIFEKRDSEINRMVNEARREFYHRVVNTCGSDIKERGELLEKCKEEEKIQNLKRRKIVLANRLKYGQNKGKLSVSLKRRTDTGMRNRIVTQKTTDFYNIRNLDRVEESALFKKVVRKVCRSGKRRVDSRVLSFNAELVQAMFRGWRARKRLRDMRRSIEIVVKKLKKYILAKKIVMGLVDRHPNKALERRLGVKILFSYFGNLGLRFSEKEISLLNQRIKGRLFVTGETVSVKEIVGLVEKTAES